jgi:curved DNA-binding protein CbpA
MNEISSVEPHSVLGVAPNATVAEINKARRTLAFKVADGQCGKGDAAEQRLTEINVAHAAMLKQARISAAPVSRRPPQRNASGFSARSRMRPGRTKPTGQTPPRAAARFLDGLKMDGLDRANRVSQKSQAAAGTAARGTVKSVFKGGPTFRPGFYC